MTNSPSSTADRYTELLALMDGDRELLQELIDVFLEDAPRRIEDVRHALDTGDAVGLYRAAHTLKGSAGNFGAPDVVGLALGLETLARQAGCVHSGSSKLEAAAVQFGLLETEMHRLVADLVAARNLP